MRKRFRHQSLSHQQSTKDQDLLPQKDLKMDHLWAKFISPYPIYGTVDPLLKKSSSFKPSNPSTTITIHSNSTKRIKFSSSTQPNTLSLQRVIFNSLAKLYQRYLNQITQSEKSTLKHKNKSKPCKD